MTTTPKFKTGDIITLKESDKDITLYYIITGYYHETAKKNNLVHDQSTSLGSGMFSHDYNSNSEDAYLINTLFDLNEFKENPKTEINLCRISQYISVVSIDGTIHMNDDIYKLVDTNKTIDDIYVLSRKECELYCPGYIDY